MIARLILEQAEWLNPSVQAEELDPSASQEFPPRSGSFSVFLLRVPSFLHAPWGHVILAALSQFPHTEESRQDHFLALALFKCWFSHAITTTKARWRTHGFLWWADHSLSWHEHMDVFPTGWLKCLPKPDLTSAGWLTTGLAWCLSSAVTSSTLLWTVIHHCQHRSWPQIFLIQQVKPPRCSS